MRMPVMLRNSSQETCGAEPTPGEATVMLSGMAFAAAMSSGTEPGRERGMDDDDQRRPVYARDRRRVAHETELEVRVDNLVAQFGRSANAQHVTVRRRTNDGFEGDVAGGPRTVLDHERAAELLGKPLGDQARMDVVRAAGGKADNEVHRPGRKGLRSRNAGHRRHCRNTRGQMEGFAAGKVYCTPRNVCGRSLITVSVSRTCQPCRSMSAFGGKADMAPKRRFVRL